MTAFDGFDSFDGTCPKALFLHELSTFIAFDGFDGFDRFFAVSPRYVE